MPLRAGKEDRGFTLIEVLVALTILGLSFAVLMTLISRGLDTSRRSQLLAGASGLAQSLLAQAGVLTPIRVGNSQGSTENGYAWLVHVEPFVVPDRDDALLSAAKVTVTVSWRDGDAPQEIELSTLRLMPKATQ